MRDQKGTIGEWQTPPDYRKKQEQWNKEFLFFSVGIFLCITSSITLVAVMSNFTMTYQARNLLVEIFTSKYQETSSPTSGTTLFSTVSTEATSQSTSFNTDRTTSRDPISTTRSASSTLLTNDSSTITTSSSTPGPQNKKNPISLLNEIHQQRTANYECMERCKSPSIIAAKLNLSLSANGKGDNYLHLTIPVCTSSGKVAKRRVAHYALETLYKDHLNEAETDEEWNVRVPPECDTTGAQEWTDCRRINSSLYF